ncbi:MAG: aspartate kinase [Bacteroidales bacterium]|nr:aspartate kinase [Bacteroidales bacterium]
MQIFKFGGASVKDAPAIRNLLRILQLYAGEELVVVISAMGKTTNFLERVLKAYSQHEDTSALVEELMQYHNGILEELLPGEREGKAKMASLRAAMERKLAQPYSGHYDYEYDQLVSFGEMMSTTLISHFLQQSGVANTWLNACDLVLTDMTYREGKVDWTLTAARIRQAVPAALQAHKVVITQGFIAGTSAQTRVTLGREGSDYTAAIFAYCLDASRVTIWKDVPGLLNADPKRFSDAVKLDEIPYQEALELSYYGASVIHPKTLKPLQNKHIPLFVKSFFHPENPGSMIGDCKLSTTIPSFIVKDNQTLLTLFPKDFSFVAEENLSEIFTLFAKYRIKINMMQNSALSFSVCTGTELDRVQKCVDELQNRYRVKYNEGVTLVTIRHYTPDAIRRITTGRTILLRQTSRRTIQYVLLPIK